METSTINQTQPPAPLNNNGVAGNIGFAPVAFSDMNKTDIAYIFKLLDSACPLDKRYTPKKDRKENEPPPKPLPMTVLIYLERALSTQVDGSYQRNMLWLSRQSDDVLIDIQYYQTRFANYDRNFEQLERLYQNDYQNITAIRRLRQIFEAYKPSDNNKYPKQQIWYSICFQAALAFFRDSKKDQILKNRTTRGEKRQYIKRGTLAYKVALVKADIIEYRSKQAHKPLSWNQIAEILPRTHKKLFKGETITGNYIRKLAKDICPDIDIAKTEEDKSPEENDCPDSE